MIPSNVRKLRSLFFRSESESDAGGFPKGSMWMELCRVSAT